MLRLINCLEGALVLHAFVLSLLWHSHPGVMDPGATDTHAPLTVRLIARPSKIVALPATNHHSSQEAVAHASRSSSSSIKPAYFTAKELTRMPEMTGQPPVAVELAQGVSGEVVFKLSISSTGEVKKVERVSSTLPRNLEGELAFQLYRSKYRAGEIDGVAVDSEMIIALKLDSSGWIADKIPVLRQGPPSNSP